MSEGQAHIVVEKLSMKYGDFLIQRDLSFTIKRSDIFVIMGGSGCGKSTLLKHLIGLNVPAQGRILYDQLSFWDATTVQQESLLRRMGVLYQKGALWTSMTIAENVAMPIRQYTKRPEAEIRDIVEYKLALVGLSGFEEYYPSEISGGISASDGT